MSEEQVFAKLFGLKLISYRQLETGQYVGSGLLNPLLDRFSLIPVLYLQAKFYKQYRDLGEWHGKRVANPFAPPVGSRPQFRALKNLVKTHVLGRASASHHLRENDQELTTQEAKRLIDESLDLGICIIAFTGGEPLLRHDIFELVDYVDQRKAMPIMFTNGLLLSDENIDSLADAGLYTLFVSLDSTSAEEHDRMRGMPGLFDTAVEGLKRMKEKGVFVAISSYASRSGTERGMYRKLYEFARELGMHNVILFDNVPTGRLMKDTSIMLTREQREEILEYSMEIFRNSTMPPLSSQPWQTSLAGYLGGIGCLAANIQYYVSAYGEVIPYPTTPRSPIPSPISPKSITCTSRGRTEYRQSEKLFQELIDHLLGVLQLFQRVCLVQDDTLKHIADLLVDLKELWMVGQGAGVLDRLEHDPIVGIGPGKCLDLEGVT